jgi:hypothetical protein
MNTKGRLISLFFLALALGSALQARAAQESQQAVQAPDQTLKDRASAYYQALSKGDRMTAYEFVAPESKNDFFALGNLSVTDIRIVGFDVPNGTGDMAKVKIQESAKPQTFHESVDIQLEESWKRIGGNWFIVLPSSKEVESPFGRLSFDKQAAQQSAGQGTTPAPGPAPNLDEIKRRAQASTKNADPDEYLLNLKKAQAQAQAERAKDPKSKDENGKNSVPTDQKPSN